MSLTDQFDVQPALAVDVAAVGDLDPPAVPGSASTAFLTRLTRICLSMSASPSMRGGSSCMASAISTFGGTKSVVAEQAQHVVAPRGHVGRARRPDRRLQVGQAVDQLADAVDLLVQDRHLADHRLLRASLPSRTDR